MSKQDWTPRTEDIENTGCDENEIEMLCDIFEDRMKRLAPTLVRKAWFALADFDGAAAREIDGFTLTLEKLPATAADAQHWTGLFEAPGRRLRVQGTIEKV